VVIPITAPQAHPAAYDPTTGQGSDQTKDIDPVGASPEALEPTLEAGAVSIDAIVAAASASALTPTWNAEPAPLTIDIDAQPALAITVGAESTDTAQITVGASPALAIGISAASTDNTNIVIGAVESLAISITAEAA
jgi:hypothetical protein